MERGDELLELNRTELELNRAASKRNEAAFDRNKAAFDRNTQAFERMIAGFDRFEQKMDEHTIFIRDMNRRNEVVVQQLLRDQEKFMTELLARDKDADRKARDADRKTDQIIVELKDLREESRAQRGALLALIDRLPPAEAA